MRRRLRTTVLTLAAVGALAAATAPPGAAQPTQPEQTITQEVFSEDGAISRVTVPLADPDKPAPAASAAAPGKVVPIQQTGDPKDRYDLVFVGDGYTAAEQDKYHQQVLAKWAQLSTFEPFKTYKNYFNVYEVDVVSNVSGVSNDPKPGAHKDTPLGMYFWCGNMDRLLCVDQGAANRYAAQAPKVNQVVALANTTKYGGAGGGVATASGGNGNSGLIVEHELGHSIGGLADEYDYGSGDTYRGPEVGEPNVSIQTTGQMRQKQDKWARWLGQDSPDGGKVGAFDGARYYKHGINRPTENSVMRTLGREYNLPSREAMVKAFQKHTHWATTDQPAAAASGQITLALAQPAGHPHDIRWQLDGTDLSGWAGKTTVDTTTLGLADGLHTLTVTVADTTGFVADAATYTHSWQVGAP